MFSWIKVLILGQKDQQNQQNAMEKTQAPHQGGTPKFSNNPNGNSNNFVNLASGDFDDIGSVFGQPLTLPIPAFLPLIMQTIEEKGLEQEGVFRKSGLHNRKKEYIRAINSGEKINFGAEPDVHTLVSVLKKYLELLPDPILTYGLYGTLIEWVHDDSNNSNPESLRKILLFLPPAHYELSKMFFRLLNKTYLKCHINKMDSRNLANVLKPNVLKPPIDNTAIAPNPKNGAGLNDLKLMFVDEFECKKLMKILIEEYDIVFGESSNTTLSATTTSSPSPLPSPVLSNEVNVTIDVKKFDTKNNKRCSERIVGIDLGTTFTKMAVKEGSNIHIFSTMGTANRVPSVVCYVLKQNNDKVVYVGEQAKEKYLFQQGKNDTAFLVTQSKRILGLNRWSQTVLSVEESLNYDVVSDDYDRAMIRMRKFDEQGTFFDLYPQQVAAEILKHMRAIYEQKYTTSNGPMRAIITVPAIYNEIQRRATLEAAIIAGIDVEKLISEPNAAAVKHLHSFIEYKKQESEKLKSESKSEKKEKVEKNDQKNLTKFEILGEAEVDGYYLVFDFGGGTLDLTLIEVSQWAKKYSVLATGGNARLGGCDIDDLLFKFFYSQLEKKFHVKLDNSPMLTMKEKLRNNKSLLKLLKECERVKQELTVNGSSEIQLEQFMTKEQLKLAAKLYINEKDSDNSEEDNNTSKKNSSKNPKISKKAQQPLDSDDEDDEDDDQDEEDDKVLTITIEDFKQLMEKSWIKKQLLSTLEELFANSSRGIGTLGKKILPININSVLLAGGSSQIPIVKDWLFKFFPKGIMILVPTQMDHVVCQGAAILGHSCLLNERMGDKLNAINAPVNNEYSLESIVEARDVIPFTLGIECAGDEIWPMINKFERLPAKETEIFETSDSSLSLIVKQGDSETASECDTLTVIDICGLSYNNSNIGLNKVSVTFLVDTNGVFSIEAFDVNNPDNHLIKVISTKGRLSENDIGLLRDSIDSTLVSYKEGGVGKRLNDLARLVYRMEYAIRSIGKNDLDGEIRGKYSPVCQKYLNFVHGPHDAMNINDVEQQIIEVEALIQKIKEKKL